MYAARLSPAGFEDGLLPCDSPSRPKAMFEWDRKLRFSGARHRTLLKQRLFGAAQAEKKMAIYHWYFQRFLIPYTPQPFSYTGLYRTVLYSTLSLLRFCPANGATSMPPQLFVHSGLSWLIPTCLTVALTDPPTRTLKADLPEALYCTLLYCTAPYMSYMAWHSGGDAWLSLVFSW